MDNFTAIASAIGLIVPQIPGLIQAADALFGHSADTGVKRGDHKLSMVVGSLQTILGALANAGLLPSAPVVDPAMPAALVGAIQSALVAGTPAQLSLGTLGIAGTSGTLGALAPPPSPVVRLTTTTSGAMPQVYHFQGDILLSSSSGSISIKPV